jgi:hypothetical protein
MEYFLSLGPCSQASVSLKRLLLIGTWSSPTVAAGEGGGRRGDDLWRALCVNQRGRREMRGRWGIGGIWWKSGGKKPISMASGRRIRAAARCRHSRSPDRVLSRRGRHGSTGSFIRLVLTPAAFWGRGCGHVFGPEPKYRANTNLGVVWDRQWRCC